MSNTSFLYHVYQIRGFKHVNTQYVDQSAIFHIRYADTQFRCPECLSANIVRNGTAGQLHDLARVHGDLDKDAIKGQLQPAIDKETSRKVEKTQEHEAKVEKQRGKELARA